MLHHSSSTTAEMAWQLPEGVGGGVGVGTGGAGVGDGVGDGSTVRLGKL